MEPQYLTMAARNAAQDTAWCAVYTRHQHERTVEEALTGKGFEVLLPLYKSARHWNDRNKVLMLPLFPCYVFVRGGVTRRLAVLATPGVHMILKCGDLVATVPDEEIDAIRKTVNGPGKVEPHPFLKCGEWARIKRGPMQGIKGILVRKKNFCRLVLSVDMVSQSIAVEVDAADVEPIVAHSRGLAVNRDPGPHAPALSNVQASPAPRVE
jgi:transcription antitermination factor NusG